MDNGVFPGARRAADYDDESGTAPPTRVTVPDEGARSEEFREGLAARRDRLAAAEADETADEFAARMEAEHGSPIIMDVPVLVPRPGPPVVVRGDLGGGRSHLAAPETAPQEQGERSAARELMVDSQPVRPAATGWRALVGRATFGAITPRASAAEVAQLDDAAAARARWRGPKTVVVANPKGGVGKTSTTVGLAATFGDVRGGAVLAWDANETLGTLGLRTPPVQHPATAVDLLHEIALFETRMARRGDLADIVRAQEAGNFHVLASDEDPGRMSQIDANAFARLHQVLFRYYDVLVIDTGNNPRASNFAAALDVADALVIPLSWAEDKVVTAGRLIDQLEQMRRGDLVARAVTVVTGAPGSQVTPEQVGAWRAWFAERTAGVVEVPTDSHIAGGGPIAFDRLAPATRRAYLAAASAVGRVFTASDERNRALALTSTTTRTDPRTTPTTGETL